MPDTWDDFYTVLARLQKGGMQVGIAENPQIYELFPAAERGTLYSSDMEKNPDDGGRFYSRRSLLGRIYM
ncbi:MAG: hypothetical protein ACLU9S_01905 [Oscillospiraceae bacterium]